MWNVWKWKTALFLGVFCALFTSYLSEEDTAKLSVQYPAVSGNYSVVTLTCRDAFGNKLSGAEFLKNGTLLTSGPESHQVTIINDTGDGEISFSFTQEQEGVFSCGKGENVSAGIGLAGKNLVFVNECNKSILITASPSMNFGGVIVLSSLTSFCVMSCSIRPGTLEDSYSVEWLIYYAEEPRYEIIEYPSYYLQLDATYCIRRSNNELSVDEYLCSARCRVYIQHRSDQPNITIYYGPVMNCTGITGICLPIYYYCIYKFL